VLPHCRKFPCLATALRTQQHALILGSPSQPRTNSALKNSAIDQKIEKLPTKSVLLVGFGGIDAEKKSALK
jgi:hypothetical protein